jgi:hypothetical protein
MPAPEFWNDVHMRVGPQALHVTGQQFLEAIGDAAVYLADLGNGHPGRIITLT